MRPASTGAPLRNGRFQVTAGSSYGLVASDTAIRPVNYNAELALGLPYLRGPALTPAGRRRWAVTVLIDDDTRGRTWNVGIKVGRAMMRVVPLRVAS